MFLLRLLQNHFISDEPVMEVYWIILQKVKKRKTDTESTLPIIIFGPTIIYNCSLFFISKGVHLMSSCFPF